MQDRPCRVSEAREEFPYFGDRKLEISLKEISRPAPHTLALCQYSRLIRNARAQRVVVGEQRDTGDLFKGLRSRS